MKFNKLNSRLYKIKVHNKTGNSIDCFNKKTYLS